MCIHSLFDFAELLEPDQHRLTHKVCVAVRIEMNPPLIIHLHDSSTIMVIKRLASFIEWLLKQYGLLLRLKVGRLGLGEERG